MRLISLEWENFGSYFGTHKFRMENRGLTLVRGQNLDEPRMDSNGSGKSTIFDALDWCWFGKSPRGSHSDSMVNEEAEKQRGAQCRVSAKLLDDSGNEIVVERGRTKSKTWLNLKVGDEDLTTLDTAETQTRLEAVLGLSRDTFHAAVLFAQGDLVHYADSTDAERMRILTRILQLEELDGYLETVKAKVTTAKAECENFRDATLVLASKIEALESRDFTESIAAWESQREAQRLSVLQRRQQLHAEIVELQSQTKNLESLIQRKAELDRELSAGYSPDPTLAQQQSEAKAALAQCDQALAVDMAESYRLTGVIQKFGAMQEGECSQCGQPVTQAHLAAEIAKAQAAQTAVEAKVQAGQGVRAEWAASVAALDAQVVAHRRAYDESRAAKAREASGLAAEISGQTLKQQRAASAHKESAMLDAQEAEIEAKKNPNVEQQARHLEEVVRVKASLELEKGKLAKAEDDLQYLEFWYSAFGPKGLKSYILDSRLQELTDAANQWVHLLTGGTIWVRFESQKKKRSSKGMTNAPDLRVFRWNPDGTTAERSYRDWSGGEKQRISFAVDFGLTRLIAQRASHSYNFLGLDEVFRHLDRSGKEAVMEMLQQLSLEKETVLVVEHDHEFQSQFENTISVVKQNRRSVLREDNDGEGSNQTPQAKVSGASVPVDPVGKRRPVRTPVRRPVVAD